MSLFGKEEQHDTRLRRLAKRLRHRRQDASRRRRWRLAARRAERNPRRGVR
ncbi:MAG: hypothetical protein ACTHM1_04620 [Solirubrobacteraceae bacterium]